MAQPAVVGERPGALLAPELMPDGLTDLAFKRAYNEQRPHGPPSTADRQSTVSTNFPTQDN